MEKHECYQILSIRRNANETEIRRAYRRLTFKYHPDKNRDDAETDEAQGKLTPPCASLILANSPLPSRLACLGSVLRWWRSWRHLFFLRNIRYQGFCSQNHSGNASTILKSRPGYLERINDASFHHVDV